MRQILIAAFVVALAACSPPAAPSDTSTDTVADSSAAETAAFTVEAAQLGGQWSFDRSCGLYELVFTDTGVDYYDYSDPAHVISYNGTWAIAGNSHVELAVRRLDAQGAPTGDTLTYNLDVTAPITTDLAANFGPAGGPVRAINAKQCAFEDRE